MYTFLPNIVEFSGFLFAAFVLGVFCVGTFRIILWMLEVQEPINGENPIFRRIPDLNLVEMHIPFTFKLEDTANLPTGTEEIRCKISSEVTYRLFVFWGVSIKELHHFLWRPWVSIFSAIDEGNMLEGHYQHAGTHFRSEMHADRIMNVAIPDVQLDLGAPPRPYYPLVVFLITENSDESVALINVVHVKDLVCTFPTCVLAQYLKHTFGQLSCLRQLYMAASSPVNENGVEGEGMDQLCVICQHFPVSRALIPCRHTCICAVCFLKLDTCPMCRSPIASYFSIRSEEYYIQHERRGINFDIFTDWFLNRLGLRR